MNKYWIFKGTSNFCHELEYDIDLDKDVKSTPEGFYDIVQTQDTVEGGIEVVTVDSLRDKIIEAVGRWNNLRTTADDRMISDDAKDFLLKELGL